MDDTDILAVRTNQANLGRADFVVDAWSGVALWRRIMRSAGYGIYPLIALKSGLQGTGSRASLQAPNGQNCAHFTCFPRVAAVVSPCVQAFLRPSRDCSILADAPEAKVYL
ncbi:hypothetical protein [Planktotalea arctica]|uniref:hypothetical protein n=1 Tax=Planktotalea arctica TaxID=1481893 RepID=UPI001FEAB8D5|nr:hypothetical protein [Planktotalea arctica]